jgi:Tfp pilus assembly protein PilX
MNRQSGIALVTSLFILVAVMMVGLGSIFLTQTNLRVAENIRTNAIARNNANSGLEAAYLLLENYHTSNSTFPASSTSFTLPAGSGYELSAYRFDNADQVMVRIKGTTTRGAEHEVEGLFSLYQASAEIPPSTTTGLISEGEVRVTSGASIYVDAGVHGNTGIDIKGDFYECAARDSSGTCISTTLLTDNLPITMSDLTGTCKIGGVDCDPIDYLASPMAVSPAYTTRRNNAMDLDGDGDVDTDDCFGSLPAAAASMGSVVVCASGDITLNNAFLNDVTIITDGNITLTGTATLTDTTLISTGGEVSIASGTFQGTRIFSEDSVTFSGSGPTYTWNDANTIATAGTITFNGHNDSNNTVNPIINADGTKTIGMALIAGGDITLNGSNSTNTDYYATFVTGGSFTQNGRSSVYGAVSSFGDLRFNGKFYIDSNFAYDNPDLEEIPEPEVEVLSRR